MLFLGREQCGSAYQAKAACKELFPCHTCSFCGAGRARRQVRGRKFPQNKLFSPFLQINICFIVLYACFFCVGGRREGREVSAICVSCPRRGGPHFPSRSPACRSLPCPSRSVFVRSAAAYFAGSTRVLCGKYSRAFRKGRGGGGAPAVGAPPALFPALPPSRVRVRA